ncbi:MAG TPA: hypothetical protein ENI98_12985 [Gammaproteobacteria bacterium]|nr:hypothetical protein [Gammaproteobacteria bacterium]
MFVMIKLFYWQRTIFRVLGIVFLATALLTSPTFPQSVTEIPSYKDRLLIRVQNITFSVPYYSDLHLFGPDAPKATPIYSNGGYYGRVFEGPQPYTVKDFLLAWPRYEPPILDVLLGRKSKYQIQRLSIGPGGGLLANKAGTPSDKSGFLYVDGKEPSALYRSDRLALFGNPIFVRCMSGHPSRKSEGEDACTIYGLISQSEGISIQLEIRTGDTVDGYWPDFDVADTEWFAPLAEVEKAVLEMIVND